MTIMIGFLILALFSGPQTYYRALYESGVDFPTFVEQISSRKEMWDRNVEKARIPAPLLERAKRVDRQLYLLIIAVDGCSDSANTIPWLGKLAAQVPKLDLRIVHPDAGRPVMLSHLTPDGRPATPTVLVLDADFNKVGAFIERPAPLQELAIASLEKGDPGTFLATKFAWYNEDDGRTTLEEVVAIMELAGR